MNNPVAAELGLFVKIQSADSTETLHVRKDLVCWIERNDDQVTLTCLSGTETDELAEFEFDSVRNAILFADSLAELVSK